MIKLRKSFLASAAAAMLIASAAPALAVQTVDNLQFTQGAIAAPQGTFGEDVSASVLLGSAVTLATTATPYNLVAAGISLPAGEWMCSASVTYTGAGTTTTLLTAAFNSTSATLPTNPAGGYSQVGGAAWLTAPGGVQVPPTIVQVPAGAPQVEYLVVQASFTGSAPTAYGQYHCTRLR
jgi:hypothetical protein